MSFTQSIKQHDFSDVSNVAIPYNILSESYGHDLAVKQLQLEHEAYELGEKRFRQNLERQIANDQGSDSAAAKPLLETLHESMCAALREAISNLTHRSVVYKLAPLLDVQKTAAITLKTLFNKLVKEGDSSTDGTALMMSVAGIIESELRYGRIREEERAYFTKHVDKALKKRAQTSYKVQFMKAVEAHMIDSEALTSEWKPWDDREKLAVGILAVEAAVACGLCERDTKRGKGAKVHTVIRLTDESLELVSQRAFSLAGISPVYQPCVVPPKKWQGTKNGGYWSNGRKPTAFIRAHNAFHLKRYEDVHMPNVYKSVNIAQETPWKVHSKVLNVLDALMSWKHVPIEKFPEGDAPEKPEKPEDIDTNEESLKNYKRKMVEHYQKEAARKSRRLKLQYTHAQAKKFSQFKAVWFPANLDWRGRLYYIPAFNPQGNDMTKGLLTFARSKPIGEEGFYWLKIHGANCMSTLVPELGAKTDKIPLDDRAKWVDDNSEMIRAIAKNPLDNTEWMEADSPFCFLAFCFEYEGVMTHGLNYSSSLPIAFDASCSGTQHFSCMLLDEIGGHAVNLTAGAYPRDIYKIVADKVNVQLEIDAKEGSFNQMEDKKVIKKGETEMVSVMKLGTRHMAKTWLNFKVTRSETKRSVMTVSYGSKKFGFSEQIMEDTIRPAIEKGTGECFREHSFQYAIYLAGLIWDAVSTTVIAAVEAMKWLQKYAKLLAATLMDKETGEIIKPALPVHWTTTDGFPVWQEYREYEETQVRMMFAGSAFRPRMQRGKGFINARKQESGIAPNFTHSNDANHLRVTVVYAYDVHNITDWALVHDSFGTLAADAGNLFKAVRVTMVDIYSNNDVLAQFSEEAEKQLAECQLDEIPEMPKKGNLDLNEILQSPFAFS